MFDTSLANRHIWKLDYYFFRSRNIICVYALLVISPIPYIKSTSDIQIDK